MTPRPGASLHTSGPGLPSMTASILPIPWSRRRSTSGKRKCPRLVDVPIGRASRALPRNEVKALMERAMLDQVARRLCFHQPGRSSRRTAGRPVTGPPCLERDAVRQSRGHARRSGRSTGRLTDPSGRVEKVVTAPLDPAAGVSVWSRRISSRKLGRYRQEFPARGSRRAAARCVDRLDQAEEGDSVNWGLPTNFRGISRAALGLAHALGGNIGDTS